MKTINPPSLLRDLREHAGLSQRGLGSVLCISQALVSRWESGDIEPSLVDLARLAEALGRPPKRPPSTHLRSRGRRRGATAVPLAIASEIRIRRAELGWSRTDLSRRAVVSLRRLRVIECGREATPLEAERLLGVLGISLETVLTNSLDK